MRVKDAIGKGTLRLSNNERRSALRARGEIPLLCATRRTVLFIRLRIRDEPPWRQFSRHFFPHLFALNAHAPSLLRVKHYFALMPPVRHLGYRGDHENYRVLKETEIT